MAKQQIALIIIGLTIVLGGCATQVDNIHTTYITPEGAVLNRVSTLKRLVILPPSYEIVGDVSNEWSVQEENQKIQDAAIRYLEDWRDYRVKPASGTQVENSFSIEELRIRLLGYLSRSGQKTKLPSDASDAIKKLATTYEADGLIVLGLRYDGLDSKRWAKIYGVTFFTLGFGMTPYLASLGTQYIAAIFDARNGELVWFARSHGGSFSEPDAATYVGSFAFGSLPNALPQVMFDKPQ